MTITKAFTGLGEDVSAAGTARTLRVTQAASQAVAAAAHPAAVAITPPRKRRSATAIDASVHRGTM